jgi:hypothetical protein
MKFLKKEKKSEIYKSTESGKLYIANLKLFFEQPEIQAQLRKLRESGLYKEINRVGNVYDGG